MAQAPVVVQTQSKGGGSGIIIILIAFVLLIIALGGDVQGAIGHLLQWLTGGAIAADSLKKNNKNNGNGSGGGNAPATAPAPAPAATDAAGNQVTSTTKNMSRSQQTVSAQEQEAKQLQAQINAPNVGYDNLLHALGIGGTTAAGVGAGAVASGTRASLGDSLLGALVP